jgi:hypothetical protein
MRLRIIAGAVAVVGVVAAGIATGALGSDGKTTSHPRSPRIIVADGDQLLPSESLADWSSFADDLAIVTITSERRLQPSAVTVRIPATLGVAGRRSETAESAQPPFGSSSRRDTAAL